MSTEGPPQQLPPSKREREEELDAEQEAEEIEPITSLTDLPASVLMRIHERILGGAAKTHYRSRKLMGSSRHHDVCASACWSPTFRLSSCSFTSHFLRCMRRLPSGG
jgi:hypothetical protein